MMLESEDGTPHMAYYDKENAISFVWSGYLNRPIQVCPGGYGERVTDTIEIPNWWQHIRSHLDILDAFQEICEGYVARTHVATLGRCFQCGRELDSEGTCCHRDICSSCEDWNEQKAREGLS